MTMNNVILSYLYIFNTGNYQCSEIICYLAMKFHEISDVIMLLSAKFENIYSFNEETRILFTASKSDQLPLQVSRAEKRDDISVLRMGLIYGANASGKSNIIKCLAIIKEFALNGWSNLKYNYFKMTDEPQERSSIELEFKADNQFFAYGIAFSKGGLLEEWLYKTGNRNDTMIFERKRNGDSWDNTIAPQFLKDEDGQFLKFLIDFLGANPYKNPDSKKAVHEFIENLNHGMGLEKALLNTKATDEVENDIVCKVWNLIEYADRDVYIKMLNGEDMALRPLLDFIIYKDPAKICNIVTTNYDRIIEYAACQTDAYINTGFTPNIVGHPYNKIEFSPKKLESEYTGTLNIWKVHGSLDWFKKDDKVLSLTNTSSIPHDYTPCIITPGTNKYERTQQEPYREIFSHVDTVFNTATGFLCIGYGFNDSHVHPVLLKIAQKRGVRILLVTKDITKPIEDNVINAGYDYIAIYSDGSNGTIFKTPSGSMAISDEIYWNIGGFEKIYK